LVQTVLDVGSRPKSLLLPTVDLIRLKNNWENGKFVTVTEINPEYLGLNKKKNSKLG
jgi:hypothetical protein